MTIMIRPGSKHIGGGTIRVSVIARDGPQFNKDRGRSRSVRRARRIAVAFLAAAAWLCILMPACSSAGARVIAYYPPKGTYPSYTQIDYSQMTHIAHAFVWPNTNGTLNVTSDFKYYPQLIQAAHAHGVKIIISVGGSGGSTAFSSMVANPVALSNFVANLTAFCVSNNYDGADFDWEAPASTADRTNFTLLVQQTRAAFNAVNPSWTLSAAVQPTSSSGQWLDVTGLQTNLSWFGVMTYDFNGSWSAKAGFNAPLYGSTNEPVGGLTYCVDAGIQYYISRGAAPSNLCVGVPFYGFQFTCTNLWAVTNGPSTDITYSNAVVDISNGWARVWNSTCLVPYLVDSSHTHLASYDDPQSVQYKCEYAVGRGLGGAIIWELGDDAINGQTALLSVMGTNLLGATNVVMMLDTFEGSTDFFDSQPTASPLTLGISTNSTAALTTNTAHSGTNSLMLVLQNNGSSNTNWVVPFLSNGGNPAGQPNVRTNGYVGFWLQTSAGTLSVGIAVDDANGTELSVNRFVTGDGSWHLYEWNLADPSQWASLSNGQSAVITGPTVTVDSIWFYSPKNSPKTTIYLDDVYQRQSAYGVGAPIASAGSNQMVAASNNVFTVTLNGSASSSPRQLPLTYQWTQIAGPTVTLVNPTNSVASFSYTAVVYTNTSMQFQLSVNDGLFTSNGVTTVTLLPNSVGAAGPISGSASVNTGANGVTYSISSVLGATTYAWSVPSGATITSGQGATSILVNYGCAASSGNVSVTPSNGSINGGSTNLLVTVTGVGAAGSISGSASVNAGTSGVTYSISSVSGATTYMWSVPSGASISSGQNSTAITVNYGCAASSGTVIVTPSNANGCTGTAASLPVTVTDVGTAGSISGSSAVCVGQSGVTYSISSVSGATTYTWSVPLDATIASGQGSTSITVTWGATSGAVTVIPANANGCAGTGAGLSVTVNAAPGVTSNPSPQTVCAGGTASFSISASGAGLTYQWRKNGSVINNDGGSISGSATATLTLTGVGTDDSGASFDCVVSGTCSPPATSSAATLSVNPSPTAFNITGGGSYCAVGGGVAVGLDGSQPGVNYQLRWNGNPDGAPVAGTGTAISFTNQTSAGTYTVIASNATSGCTATMNGSASVLSTDLFACWQLQYFECTNCPQAAAGADADGTGQNNLFKYVAGLDPTNPASVFTLQIAAVSNPVVNLMYGPIATGRTYTLQFNANLANGTYNDLIGFIGPSTSSINNQITITDPNAVLTNEFYRVHISFP